MIVWRIARVILHLMLGLATCALVFPFANAAAREQHIHRWSLKLLVLCGVQVELVDTTGGSENIHALIVANHTSWLDIFVINAVQPCRFVAKSDIRNWPLIGWLCHKSGTIFISRGSQRDVRRIYRDLVDSLRDGERIAFFPEGTTVAQGTLLPFHANLFEAAIEAGVLVQPHALRYLTREGQLHAATEFIDDTSFVQSLIRILRAERIIAQLTLLPPMETSGWHRRELAAAARARIAESLGYAEEMPPR
jgi:1-acyl-sn-glycerol-3-phosphate acyltransferase